MALTREQLAWLLGELVAEDPHTRKNSAGTITDWENSLSQFDVRMIVRCASLLAATEGPGDVREAQLHAVMTIFDPTLSTRDDVEPIFAIPSESLDLQDKEYVDEVKDVLNEFEQGLWKT